MADGTLQQSHWPPQIHLGWWQGHVFSSGNIKFNESSVSFLTLICILIQEGDVAFDVKDYLIDQERVDYVEIDQDVYYGKFSSQKHELWHCDKYVNVNT